jgi:hypothetical protein
MGDQVLVSGWDTVAFMTPFLAVLAMWLLRLDQRFASPRRSTKPGRTFCGVDSSDGPLFSDPDGQPWKKSRIWQIEATLAQSSRSGELGSTS